MNGGAPSEDTIEGYINIYSWPGWIEMLVWSIGLEIWYEAWRAMATGVLAAILWYMNSPESSMPLCKNGEAVIWWWGSQDCSEYEAYGFY